MSFAGPFVEENGMDWKGSLYFACLNPIQESRLSYSSSNVEAVKSVVAYHPLVVAHVQIFFRLKHHDPT